MELSYNFTAINKIVSGEHIIGEYKDMLWSG